MGGGGSIIGFFEGHRRGEGTGNRRRSPSMQRMRMVIKRGGKTGERWTFRYSREHWVLYSDKMSTSMCGVFERKAGLTHSRKEPWGGEKRESGGGRGGGMICVFCWGGGGRVRGVAAGAGGVWGGGASNGGGAGLGGCLFVPLP